MKKICFVLSSLAGGGAERFFINLLNHFDRSKFQIFLILFNDSGEYKNSLPKDITIINLHHSDQRTLPNTLQVVLKLKKTIADLKPEVVFSTMGYTNLISLMAKAVSNTKARFFIHEAGIIRHQLSYEGASEIKRKIYRFFCRFAQGIIFPTEAVKEDFIKYINVPASKCTVIPTPSDFDYIDRKLHEPLDLKKFGLKHDKKIIISVGRLEEIKGFDIGIRAFAEVCKEVPCDYWILGQGTQEPLLRKLSQELGVADKVFFLGFQENPFIFLKMADVYLLPSRSETLPYVLIEAMYSQCPSVVTPFNNSVSSVITNTVDGIIVDNFDPNHIANALKQLLLDSSLRAQMKTLVKGKVGKYSTQNVCPVYEQLFLAGGR